MSGETAGQDDDEYVGGRGWAELPATVAAELFGREDLLGDAAAADRSRRVCKGWAAYAINHKRSFLVRLHSVVGQGSGGWATLPSLKKLAVHGDDAEPDPGFPRVDRNIDSFLSALSRVAPLTSLTVTLGSAVFRDDTDLETLARVQPSLRVLGLFLCRWHKTPPYREVTVEGLVRLLMSLPDLEELHLHSESRTKDGPHPALALKALGSSQWLDLPAERRSRLKKLVLSSFLPGPEGLAALEALPNLTDLSLCSMNFRQLSLARLTTLKHLDIRSPGGAASNPLETMDLSSLRSLRGLEGFSIKVCNVLPDDDVKTIASLRSLRKLDIQGLRFMDPNGPATPQDSPCDFRLLMEPLAPTLTALSISEFPWGAYGPGLQVLRPLTNLQTLSISSVIPMLERDLSGLEDLTALTELSLKGISLNREQAESFARLPRLRSLSLSMSIHHYQRPEQQGAILESITSLKSLTDLDLTACEVTLNQVAFLARRNGSLPSLKHLGLCWSKAIQQVKEASGPSSSSLPAWMGGGEALSFSRRFGLVMSWRDAEPVLLKSPDYTCEMAGKLPFWSDLMADVLMDELEAYGMGPGDVLKVLSGAERGDHDMQCILDSAQESLNAEIAQLGL